MSLGTRLSKRCVQNKIFFLKATILWTAGCHSPSSPGHTSDEPCTAERAMAGGEKPLRCPGPHQLMATSPPEPLRCPGPHQLMATSPPEPLRCSGPHQLMATSPPEPLRCPGPHQLMATSHPEPLRCPGPHQLMATSPPELLRCPSSWLPLLQNLSLANNRCTDRFL